MSSFPTAAESVGFTTVTDVVTWVGLQPVVVNSIHALTGDLGTRTRNWALLAHEVIRAAVAQATISVPAVGTAGATGHVPAAQRNWSPLEAAQVGMVWRIARRLAVGWEGYTDIDPLAAIAAGTQAPQGAVGAVTQPAMDTRKVKLSTHMDQSDETEVPLPSQDVHTGWQDNWIAFARGPADDDEEPNFEQLVALDARAKKGRTP